MFDYMKDEKFFPRAHYSDDDSDSGDYFSSNRKPLSKSKTPMLDNFGRDLTEMAETGKLDPSAGNGWSRSSSCEWGRNGRSGPDARRRRSAPAQACSRSLPDALSASHSRTGCNCWGFCSRRCGF